MNTDFQNKTLPTVAVIPAAGKGTRFLPSTKSTPKELHPLLNKPLIHCCLEELKAAGVKEAIIVTHPDKTTLEKYFSNHDELKSLLQKDNKNTLVKTLESIEELPKVTFVNQLEQKGLAHAIHCAKEAINGRDFFVLLPDEIFIAQTNELNPCVELLESFKKNGLSAISLLEVDKSLVSSYGVAKIESENNQSKIVDVVEKPSVEKAPSNLILPGRYLFKNEILSLIESTQPKNGEVQLTDAIVTMAKDSGVSAVTTKSMRFDGGSVLGFLKANITAGLMDSEIGEELKSFLKNVNLT